MPLGIVSTEDYEKDLNSPDVSKQEMPRENEVKTPSEPDNSGEPVESVVSIEADSTIGRGKGNTGVPQSIRKIIGESAIEEGAGAAAAIGKFLGLSQSSVSAYARGATSTATYNQPNVDLLDHLDKTRKRISKKAAGKLFKALNVIDEDKLDELDALQASTVAKNMSAIIKHMEPEDKTRGNTFNGPVITFYAPHIVTEDKFDVINVTE